MMAAANITRDALTLTGGAFLRFEHPAAGSLNHQEVHVMAENKSTHKSESTTREEEIDLKILDDFEAQPSQITDEEIAQIEKVFGRNLPFGPWRRSALASLSRSGRQLIEAIENDRKAALALAAAELGIENYANRLRDLADLMDKASTRILVTLAFREDMTEIRAEAKAEYEKPLSDADEKRETELALFIEALDNVPPHQRPLLDELLILTSTSPVAGEVLEKSRLAGLDLEATIAAMRKPAIVN